MCDGLPQTRIFQVATLVDIPLNIFRVRVIRVMFVVCFIICLQTFGYGNCSTELERERKRVKKQPLAMPSLNQFQKIADLFGGYFVLAGGGNSGLRHEGM